MIRGNDILQVVLVVEENPEELAGLRDLLEEPGRIVIPRTSGREALRLVRFVMHVDAVIASDALSDIETFQMLIDLKRLAPAVPFIMLLSPGPDAEHLKGLSPGIFEYVERCLAATELGTMVDLALERASGRPAPVFSALSNLPRRRLSADIAKERRLP